MSELLYLVGTSTLQTLIMVLFSTVFSMILGFPLGVLLCITNENGIMPRKVLNQVLSRIVNILRSFPFAFHCSCSFRCPCHRISPQ